MTKIDTKPNFSSWEHFSIRNPGSNARDAFEELCKNLFARRMGTSPANLVVRKNQTGIECEPFKKGVESWSFQAKFKDNKVDFPAFRESINEALEQKKIGEYGDLTQIICYTNRVPGKKSKVEKEIKDLAEANGV